MHKKCVQTHFYEKIYQVVFGRQYISKLNFVLLGFTCILKSTWQGTAAVQKIGIQTWRVGKDAYNNWNKIKLKSRKKVYCQSVEIPQYCFAVSLYRMGRES